MKVRTADELMRENLLVKHLAGSHAYGTSLPTSDTDYRGIFCGDPIHVRTPFYTVRECEDGAEEDTKFYELAHFMKLCLDCNPNIIETLWVDESDILYQHEAYKLLRVNRDALLSSKAAFTFSGYALAQLKRIKGHNKWINNPQREACPMPYEFLSVVQYFDRWRDKWTFSFAPHAYNPLRGDVDTYLIDHRFVPYGRDIYGVYEARGHRLWDQYGKLNTAYEGNRHKLGVPRMIVKFNKDDYRLAKERHEQYWEWKRNRNKTRGELEEQHGYDTKHAMHLVRLLRMGEEILETGQVIVKRPDAAELLAIRNGAWDYNDIVQYAEIKDRRIREDLYKNTQLRKKPDIKIAAQLLMQAQNLVWDKNDPIDWVKLGM